VAARTTSPAQARSPNPRGAESVRARLARTALAAALSVPGVLRGDGGRTGLYATATSTGKVLQGVICSAASSGGYEVSLQLVCAPVPLMELAARIRAKVHTAAARAKVADELASVSIHFSDIALDG
jgi:hypothetical protein